ncbi:MAG: rhodanese-like domain-containing protein [Mycoplasmatales bacterium]
MEALEKHKNKIIDIREEYEYQIQHIDGVINIPMTKLLKNPQNFINKKTTYYLMCRTGKRVETVIYELKKDGYNLINIGGIIDYEK